MQRPADEEILDKYELVTPAVHIGWIPAGSVLPTTDRIPIPCLVVGCDESDLDSESLDLHLQITAAVYDPGHQTIEGDSQQLLSDFSLDGYTTLLNLLDLVRAKIVREGVVAQKFELVAGVKMQTYEEQPFPYWYGFLRFKVTGEGYPQTRYAELLN